MEIKDLLLSYDCDYLVVPNNNEFMSEFTPDEQNRLLAISGFSGSFGVAIIGLEEKYLITDGRYLLQAAQEVNGSYKIVDVSINSITSVIVDLTAKNKSIGLIKMLTSVKFYKILEQKGLIPSCKLLNCDILDNFCRFNSNRQDAVKEVISLEIAGISSEDKVSNLISSIPYNCDAILISDAASCSWLFNLRGRSHDCSRIYNAYAFVYKNGNTAICENINGLEIKTILSAIKNLAITIESLNLDVYLQILTNNIEITEIHDPIIFKKAIKNHAEIDGFIEAHLDDGAIMCKFLRWIYSIHSSGNRSITECEVADYLNNLRLNHPNCLALSFETICGFRSNGAIIHYRAKPESCSIINGDGLLLIDSGGHYKGGTTDITRTIYLGKQPTEEEKKHFTLVLKGFIALDLAHFPLGTTGGNLDLLARQFLWQEGLNYAHGTGHGVGHSLHVHESGCGISLRNNETLKCGMVISNEPGLYLTEKYGIRIENLITCVEGRGEGWLQFQTLTMVPIDHNLINFNLLSQQEKDWLDDYHNKILTNLNSRLTNAENDWLELIASYYKNQL